MELYRKTSYGISKFITERYSTSFSLSTRLIDASIRDDIYAIYGLVRVADEVVDAYQGEDAAALLDRLEKDVYRAIERGYDTNPVIHAFSLTAHEYGIGEDLIAPFFRSMAMDLEKVEYTQELYEAYIYGSAEVVGLMCLKVFCQGDEQQYESLLPGARALGSAYQKVNFLRDIAADHDELGRLYFPGVSFELFDERQKKLIVDDIDREFTLAKSYVHALPENSRHAVALSYLYYKELLEKIRRTPAQRLKEARIRVSNARKLTLLASVTAGKRRL